MRKLDRNEHFIERKVAGIELRLCYDTMTITIEPNGKTEFTPLEARQIGLALRTLHSWADHTVRARTEVRTDMEHKMETSIG